MLLILLRGKRCVSANLPIRASPSLYDRSLVSLAAFINIIPFSILYIVYTRGKVVRKRQMQDNGKTGC